MLTEEEILLSRKIAIDALRLNTEAHKQITGKLTDGDNGYCAVGHIGEALHVSPKLHADGLVYREVAEKLGTDTQVIYGWNDGSFSFKAIADKLAKRWGLQEE